MKYTTLFSATLSLILPCITQACEVADLSSLISQNSNMVVVRGSLDLSEKGTVFNVEEQIRGPSIPLKKYNIIAQWHNEQCQLYYDKAPMTFDSSQLLPEEWAQYIVAEIDADRKNLYVPDGYQYGLPVIQNQIVLRSRTKEGGIYHYIPSSDFQRMIESNPPTLLWNRSTTIDGNQL